MWQQHQQALEALDPSTGAGQDVLLPLVAALTEHLDKLPPPQPAGEETGSQTFPIATDSDVAAAIRALSGMLKRIADAPLRAKCYLAVERCVLERRLEPTLVVGDLLLVAIHHCSAPPPPLALKQWVQKVYALRKFFEEIDFPSCQQFYVTVLTIATSIPFLAVEEGRKFVAFLFSLNAAFLTDLHSTLRRAIYDCNRKSLLQCYAEIYFRGWRECNARVKLLFEEVLQWFAETALRCTDEKQFAKLLLVLETFHAHNDDRAVAQLLEAVYGPLLFRGLDCANNALRRNAVRVLVSAFPIRNPEKPRAVVGRCVEDQFNKLRSFMRDPCPLIRQQAALGLGAVLAKHWEAIPCDVSLPGLQQLLGEAAHDKDVDVRLCAVQAVSALLENSFMLPHLKRYLPLLAPCLDDVNCAVRAAFCQLLAQVSTVGSIPFWHVVGGAENVPLLLNRLAAERNSAVSAQLVAVLLHSFLREGCSDRELLVRALTFVRQAPAGALQFYPTACRQCEAPRALTLVRALADWCAKCAGLQQEAERRPAGKKGKKEAAKAKPAKGKGKGKDKGGKGKKRTDGSGSGSDSDAGAAARSEAWAELRPEAAHGNVELVVDVVRVICGVVNALLPSVSAKAFKAAAASLHALSETVREVYGDARLDAPCKWLAAVTPAPALKAAKAECLSELLAELEAEEDVGDESPKAGGRKKKQPPKRKREAAKRTDWQLALQHAASLGLLPEVLRHVEVAIRTQAAAHSFPSCRPVLFLVYALRNERLASTIRADPDAYQAPLRSVRRSLQAVLATDTAAADRGTLAYVCCAIDALTRLCLQFPEVAEESGSKKASSAFVQALAGKLAATGAGPSLRAVLECLRSDGPASPPGTPTAAGLVPTPAPTP